MKTPESDQSPPPEPSEHDEGSPRPLDQLPKGKGHEIPDIFQAIQILKIEDLADPRVISILVQILNEKIDRIRVLDAEARRVQSEKEALAIQCARQEEQIKVSQKSHGLWAGVGIIGGLLVASAMSVTGNIPLFIVLVITGIVLSVLGATGART